MGNAACTWFGINPPGGQVVSTTTNNMNVSFCWSIRTLLIVHLICLVVHHILPVIITRHHPMRERGGNAATSQCSATREGWRDKIGVAAVQRERRQCS
jgi:hypothetical protein